MLIPFEPVKKGQSVRLRISETYTDAARYALVDGQLMWHRSFGRPRNDMVLPEGWYLTTTSVPAVITQEPDGRIRLSYWNPRTDNVDVVREGANERAERGEAHLGSRSLGHVRDDAEDVVELDMVAGFDGARDRFLADARARRLPLRVVGIEEVDVERHLPVNAHRLDLRDHGLFRPLQHAASIDPRLALRPEAPAGPFRPPGGRRGELS